MSAKEAKARIKINKLLEEAGWRFFDDESGSANIVLEPHVKITQTQISELGENFEETKSGFVDFLLLDEKGFPFVVLEAKAEKINPLSAKEQARSYANAQNCRTSFCRTKTFIESLRLDFQALDRCIKNFSI